VVNESAFLCFDCYPILYYVIIQNKYCERGAIIEDIIRIERKEESHFIFEDADFSLVTIKQLIKPGQEDAEKILREKESRKI